MPTLNWIGKDKVVSHHNEVPFHAWTINMVIPQKADRPKKKLIVAT